MCKNVPLLSWCVSCRRQSFGTSWCLNHFTRKSHPSPDMDEYWAFLVGTPASVADVVGVAKTPFLRRLKIHHPSSYPNKKAKYSFARAHSLGLFWSNG